MVTGALSDESFSDPNLSLKALAKPMVKMVYSLVANSLEESEKREFFDTLKEATDELYLEFLGPQLTELGVLDNGTRPEEFSESNGDAGTIGSSARN